MEPTRWTAYASRLFRFCSFVGESVAHSSYMLQSNRVSGVTIKIPLLSHRCSPCSDEACLRFFIFNMAPVKTGGWSQTSASHGNLYKSRGMIGHVAKSPPNAMPPSLLTDVLSRISRVWTTLDEASLGAKCVVWSQFFGIPPNRRYPGAPDSSITGSMLQSRGGPLL